jgi:hypothetical protein
MFTVADLDEQLAKLLDAASQLPERATGLRAKAQAAIDNLRAIKTALIAATPSSALSKSATPALRKRSPLIDDAAARTFGTADRDRAFEAQRIAKHRGEQTRWLAPPALHGRNVAIATGTLYVTPQGEAMLHRGATAEDRQALALLGFKQLPFWPDHADMGNPDAVADCTKALSRPGQGPLLDVLNRRR